MKKNSHNRQENFQEKNYHFHCKRKILKAIEKFSRQKRFALQNKNAQGKRKILTAKKKKNFYDYEKFVRIKLSREETNRIKITKG